MIRRPRRAFSCIARTSCTLQSNTAKSCLVYARPRNPPPSVTIFYMAHDWHMTRAERHEFANTSVIYPVLVVHDTRLDAPALGHFLENDFRSLLGTVPPGKRVAPLTVMTIQDLENLERSVESFSFVKLLEDYS